MSFRFTALPHDTYRPYRRRKRPLEERWTAPEHHKAAASMERAYPVDINGRKMLEKGRELVLDPRPEIMQPKRTPIYLGIDQSVAP